MAYRIFTGHRLESLVGAHGNRFTAPFFGPRPWIVVQSQSLSQWLKLFLARNWGGYATGDLVFQDEALRRLMVQAAPEAGRILFLDDLKFALYRHLAQALSGPLDPVFAPLTAGGPPDPLRLFELADHIAGTFHNYAMNSELWPRALAAGVMVPGTGTGADPAAFAWQSRLWRDLLTGGRGTLAGVAMERLTASPPRPQGPPVRLVVVGSAFLSRRAAAFLRAWADADLIDVDHLLLLPAPAATLTAGPGRRPWSSWGAFGQAFLESFPSPVEGDDPAPPDTALGRLQHALGTGTAFSAAPDGTLEVVSSPHPLRELEALRDRLLTALADDPTLEVHEIAVLAPDINVYAPFLDAVFGSDDLGRHLRYHVIDLDLGRENAWFRALDALLSLVSGTVDRPTLFTLVDTPAFREAWSLEPDDRDLWLDYTEEVSAWREEGSDRPPQSWSRSWDRLFTGWFRSDPAGPEGVPPLDASPSAFRSLGRFHQLVQDLVSRGRETRHPRTFLDWIRFLDQTMAAFLAPGEGTGAVLAGRLRTLALDAGSPDDPMPWAGFRSFVQDQIAHFPGRRGQLLTEGIHCSSLRPLRSIPFRVIALLGLDEGRFPRATPTPSFDLRRHEPHQEEVSGLALDRYSFWETVMAARDRLYLSYQGRNPVDGSERPPSPVLADLLDFLEEGGAPFPIVQTTVKDFAAVSPRPPTWSPRTRRRAEALAHPGRPGPAPEPDPAPGVDEGFPEVKTSEVVQAFTAPARFHLQRVRQVVLKDEDRRGVDDEEPWSLDFLDRQSWLQERLRLRLVGSGQTASVDEFLQKQTAVGRVREGVFSDRDRRELEGQAARVDLWAGELREAGWAPEAAPPPRTRWAGRPWAPEARDRLVRGDEVLVPRLLYSESLPARAKVDAALRVLLDPAPRPRLTTLTPRGVRTDLTWAPDAQATRELTAHAEAYWVEAARRPLPFYPDYLETLADRRAKAGGEPWVQSVEECWRQVHAAQRVQSEATLTRCPYAALAFADPDWQAISADLEPWWDTLFVPLLGAWA